MVACGDNGQAGGQVTQATVLARAQAWANENIAYTQKCRDPADPGGSYREDCSGFVSMAWLSGDRVGVVTTAWSAYVKEGALSATWVHEYDDAAVISLS